MSAVASRDYGYSMRTRRRPFHEIFPSVGVVLLGIVQMLTNGAIVGLEAGSVSYNFSIDIVYAGFWCSVSFFFTWVAMFFFLCLGKKRGCGIILLVLNCLSIIFAIVLIIFDSLFINSPCQCYLGNICNTVSMNCTGIINKSPLIKAQLAMAVLMLTLNLVYILLFIITIIRSTRTKSRPMSPSYTPPVQRRHSPSTTYGSPPQPFVAVIHPQYPVVPIAYNQAHANKGTQPEYLTPYLSRLERF